MDLRLDKDNSLYFDFIFNFGISNGLLKKKFLYIEYYFN